MAVLPGHVYAHWEDASRLRRPEGGIRVPGTGVENS